MNATVSLTCPDLETQDLQHLSRDFCKTLNQETDVEATLSEQPGGAGSRGDPITIGAIVLTFLTSGAAVAMFNVLKSYFERSSSMELEFKRDDGGTLVIRAENLSPDQIDHTMELAHGFFEGAQ